MALCFCMTTAWLLFEAVGYQTNVRAPTTARTGVRDFNKLSAVKAMNDLCMISHVSAICSKLHMVKLWSSRGTQSEKRISTYLFFAFTIHKPLV